MVAESARLQERLRCFHWQLEFPDVWAHGGFDCVLGNPPWEQLQPEEVKFFANIAPDIAQLAGDERKRAIQALPRQRPEVAAAWNSHKTETERLTNYLRESGSYALTAVGKLNTYQLFADRFRASSVATGGRASSPFWHRD